MVPPSCTGYTKTQEGL